MRGFDPAVEPIPVAPAAHYTMGGVVTDLDGRTELPGLYAAGECACTGVHGANRLASNSLLECLVFGRRAALASLERARSPGPKRARRRPPSRWKRSRLKFAEPCGRTQGSFATQPGSSASVKPRTS